MGNEFTDMFLIEVHSHDNIFDIVKPKYLCSKLGNFILFRNCDFTNNTRMNSLINIVLKHNEQLNVFVKIRKSNVCFNNKLQFINTNSELKLLKALSHTIIISATKILSNSCAFKNRINLISVTSGVIEFEDSIIANNTNFEVIVKLHSSLLQFEGFTNFSGNHVRYILQGIEGSYYVHTEFSTVQLRNNFVYTLSRTSVTYTENSQEICIDQFITKSKNNLDNKFKRSKKLNFTVAQINNIYTVPQYEINFLTNETHYIDCVWLASTAFQTTKSTKILNSIFNIERTFANKSDVGIIPSSICPCLNTDKYNCNKHEIGSVFPGQTLTIKLIIPEISSTKSENKYTTMMAKTYTSTSRGCQIANANEIFQTSVSHNCNEYSYTIWYNGSASGCELYLGTEKLPEIFYVNLLPCPVGFSLQKNKRIKGVAIAIKC